LLRADDTAFLIVTSAQSEPIREALWFRTTLLDEGLPFAGVIVNRFHHDLVPSGPEIDIGGSLTESLGGDLAARVAATFADYHVLASRDAANVATLTRELGDAPVLLVPQLDDEVHDVDGLMRVRRYLFASDSERARLIADVVA
jgi:anion-transporting  ArsA/GET3 family ATPase